MKSTKIFIPVFILHQIIQGYCWSAHPGNTPPGEGSVVAKYGWGIVSFPIEFLPNGITDNLGMAVLIINSFVWASIITIVATIISNKTSMRKNT